mmetsp:Transcript_3851/g.24413  ORF Transcript_3851/g.24413 Transcript_3851/m.24413 type:complete len:102 (+) Transcript_3851:170-475(+)
MRVEEIQAGANDAGGAPHEDATMRAQMQLLGGTTEHARGMEGKDAYNVLVSGTGSAEALFNRRSSRGSQLSLGNKRTSFPIVPASPCWPGCDAGLRGSGSL